ncbi:MAG: hypothetical protein ACD_17C00271G0003 [uncultured bacterium]|nr:MAG: hypothetical protein ACD_17C00271G0003 [uncultured bacterium]
MVTKTLLLVDKNRLNPYNHVGSQILKSRTVLNLALAFSRTFFMILSMFFMTLYMVTGPYGYSWKNISWGLLLGAMLGLTLIGFELLFRRFNLRSFNVAILGLFIGYFMGLALVLTLDAILQISSATIHLPPQVLEIIKISLYLFGVYLGTLFTIRSADELYISIPFVRFTPTAHRKKDLVVDSSVLSDARILDMASSGLIDHCLIVPRFVAKELYILTESQEEMERAKAKRALEIFKKLESMPDLHMRSNDTDFPETKDIMGKLIRLARLFDANILTADISRIQMANIEGVRIINLHNLSNALKPLMQAGEHIKIKIQRYGKEPRQGVGYLEDGTMVVVNGGGEYIGETIDAIVLSVKHTSSGRMIFCNAPDEEGRLHSEHDEH